MVNNIKILRTVSGNVRISVVLRFLEVVEEVVEAPARIAKGLPVVVVPPVSSNVKHVVEHRRPAHHATPRPVASLGKGKKYRTKLES